MEAKKRIKSYICKFGWRQIAAAAIVVLTLVCGVLAVINAGRDDKTSAKPFYPGIVKDGVYCYVDVAAVSDWMYRYDTTIYYLVADTENYGYTAVISDSDYAQMDAQNAYWNDDTMAAPSTIRLYGTASTLTADTAEQLAQVWGCADGDEYIEMFGPTFLDTTLSPSGNAAAMWGVFAFISALLALAFGAAGLSDSRNAGVCLKRLEELGELDEAAEQLASPDARDTDKGTVRFTRDFVFSTSGSVVKYSDVVWAYRRIVRTNLLFSSEFLVAQLGNCREVRVAAKEKRRGEDTVQLVLAEIESANPDALIGYTMENKLKFHDYESAHKSGAKI